MKYKVLDTNILLLDAHNLTTMGKDGSTIVLPETVLDEVDSKKSVLGEIGFQARSLGRMLNTAVRVDTVVDNTGATTYIELDGVSIVVVSLKQYNIDFTTDYNILNDRKIITVAKLWYDKHPETVFVSNDVMCRIRAESMGVPVADHKQVETVDISFTRELLVVDDEAFRTAHHTAVLELDPYYKPNYFNYVLTNPNTEQTKLAIVVDGKLQVIGRETETDLRKQDISPGNAAQLFFSRALQDPMIDICICESKAGSGKTAVAVSNGIRNVRKGMYDQMIYVRASIDDVEKVEEMGFRSGNEEKEAPYFAPLWDTIEFIVRSRHKGTKIKQTDLDDKVKLEMDSLAKQVNLSLLTGLGQRGRTFHNTYAIIDESQGQSRSSLQKMLTRFGQNCKIVIIGSNNQIDNPYVTKYTNGLSVLLDACKRHHTNVTLHAVSLPKVLRGPIAEFAEDLYSNPKVS